MLSNKTSYLGVDIGTSSIKIVELANVNGRPRLVTYGFTEKNLDKMRGEDDKSDLEQIVPTLTEICQKSRVNSRRAIAALPNFSVFTSVLNLPSMPQKELASAISWEAKKIIPIPLEEVILDWKIVNETETSSGAGNSPQLSGLAQQLDAIKKIFSKPRKDLKILLTGASKNLVKKYLSVFSSASLTLLSLETESFALIRSLIGNDKSVIMLIDLGAISSNLTVVDGGVPTFTRSLSVGGMTITRAISTALNVNLERAEQFKQDMSLDFDTAGNSLPQTVMNAFNPILGEIKYSINQYQDQHNRRIEKIILTGGGALLGNLTGFLSRELGVNTYVGDPWARVIYPSELKPILDRLGARFAVAVGLAMRNIE